MSEFRFYAKMLCTKISRLMHKVNKSDSEGEREVGEDPDYPQQQQARWQNRFATLEF